MSHYKKFFFLTLRNTEIGSIRPNYVSLMRNLQRQGLLAEIRIADDIDSLKKIALDFIHHPNALSQLVFSSDEELYEISRSNLTMEQKKLILPVGIESAFQILGSKVGFIEFCKKHSIPHPKTQVFKSKEQLQKFGSTFVSPMVVKGDTGAGGENVFRLNNKKDLLDYLEADINFPLILQENIASKLYSVEAFFQDGQLCGWMFSEIEELVSEFGVSIARTYLNPKDRSFTEILCKFGKSTGANGFASCSFFYSRERGYLLFEADLRPNAWHYLFDTFGMDLKSVYGKEFIENTQHPLYPKNLPTNGVTLRLAHRELAYALDNKQYRRYISVCISMTITNSYNNIPGEKTRRVHLFNFVRFMILIFAKIIYSYFPIRLRKWAGSRRISVRVTRKFLSN